ncbi:hypothetical protein ACVWYH_003203 [Bradyrhizobium sp. GM24.11]
MQVYVPFARPANQDKKHFPLGTCPAKSAPVDWRQDPEKFEQALVKLLGCHRAAADYIKGLEAKVRERQRR